jgi:hypothetical protein
MNALQFEALKVALKQDATGYVLTVKIHPDEIPEELLRDFVGARYMVAMARVNDDETAIPYKNRVKEAGMRCREIQFQEFLKQRYGLDDKSEKIATDFVYEFCNVKSRTELNGNKEAQDSWDSLLKEYDEWRFKDVPF